MAYGLLGGVENIVMRASWDDRYSRSDVLWTTLCMFLAVQALYSGASGPAGRVRALCGYGGQIGRVSPPVPARRLSSPDWYSEIT